MLINNLLLLWTRVDSPGLFWTHLEPEDTITAMEYVLSYL